MNFSKRNKSIVDFMFIIALFGAFAITGLFVVLFGARVYQTTVSNMDANYAKRTALSYVTEKIRSHDYSMEDGSEAVVVADNNGQTVLQLKEKIEDKVYITYMFTKDGYLKEFTAPADYDFKYDSGTNILRVSRFDIKKAKDALYYIDITDEYNHETGFYVALYSSSDD